MSKLYHIEKDEETTLCGRSRVGIETLLGPVKHYMSRDKFCKKCFDYRRKFEVTFSATITLSEQLIREGLSDEFASYITRLHDAEDVAKFIAFNMARNGLRVSQIEGLALHKDGEATLLEFDTDDAREVEL